MARRAHRPSQPYCCGRTVATELAGRLEEVVAGFPPAPGTLAFHQSGRPLGRRTTDRRHRRSDTAARHGSIVDHPPAESARGREVSPMKPDYSGVCPEDGSPRRPEFYRQDSPKHEGPTGVNDCQKTQRQISQILCSLAQRSPSDAASSTIHVVSIRPAAIPALDRPTRRPRTFAWRYPPRVAP